MKHQLVCRDINFQCCGIISSSSFNASNASAIKIQEIRALAFGSATEMYVNTTDTLVYDRMREEYYSYSTWTSPPTGVKIDTGFVQKTHLLLRDVLLYF